MFENRGWNWFRIFALALFLGSSTLGGCRCIKNKLGIGDKVVKPAEGSYERVIQKLFAAAIMKDKKGCGDPRMSTDDKKVKECRSFKALKKILHSDELSRNKAMIECRKMGWPSLKRKVNYFLDDKKKVSYTIMDVTELRSGHLKVFVESSESSPTPFQVKRDKKKGNRWRIASCTF